MVVDVDRPLKPTDPLPAANDTTIYLNYNYIIVSVRFRNVSIFASCDAQIQSALVTLLAIALKFPAANISTSCLSGPSASAYTTDVSC